MVYNLGVEYWEMIAVSATPDPLGEWHCYSLWFDKMPDYPKFGLWPDGYYLTINEYIITPDITSFFDGASILVFNRDELMNGVADPTILYFHFPAPNQHIGEDIASFQPSDLDGPPPPVGTPNYHVCMKDDAWGWEQDRLWIWECVVDWNDTASSHFSEVAVLETEPFATNFNQNDFIRQPGTTTRLHSHTHFMMYRLQFRQFDNYQTLLCNHTIMTGINQQGSVRWYELRNEGSGWNIYQQSTFAPDEHSRWMGSMAMDKDGNIALGYSISSDYIYPSIRATGRYFDDPINLMTFQEVNVAEGGGHQTPNNRWGDYSTMSVDPVDDFTFWYTQEYMEYSGNLDWKTRVCSFQLHRNLDLSEDSLVFMTYDECVNGKQLILKNNSFYEVELLDIEQEGYFMYGAHWYIDPYNFSFPISMGVGDSVELTVKVDFMTNNPQIGLVVDSLDITTDYKGYGVPIFLNDSLIVGLQQDITSEKDDIIRVYPNPFGDNISIEFNLESQISVDISIINQMGQIVYASGKVGVVNGFIHQVNTKDFQVGIYIIEIRDNDRILIQKKFEKALQH
jgi:hypothetical protein